MIGISNGYKLLKEGDLKNAKVSFLQEIKSGDPLKVQEAYNGLARIEELKAKKKNL